MINRETEALHVDGVCEQRSTIGQIYRATCVPDGHPGKNKILKAEGVFVVAVVVVTVSLFGGFDFALP